MPYGVPLGEFAKSVFWMGLSFVAGSTVTHLIIKPDLAEPAVMAKEQNRLEALHEVERLALQQKYSGGADSQK